MIIAFCLLRMWHHLPKEKWHHHQPKNVTGHTKRLRTWPNILLSKVWAVKFPKINTFIKTPFRTSERIRAQQFQGVCICRNKILRHKQISRYGDICSVPIPIAKKLAYIISRKHPSISLTSVFPLGAPQQKIINESVVRD